MSWAGRSSDTADEKLLLGLPQAEGSSSKTDRGLSTNKVLHKSVDSNTTLRACIFLDKGGVGKTTSTAHLGVPISEEYDTLLIDLAGKQNDLAKQFGLWEAVVENEDDWPNISTVFDDDWDTIAEKLQAQVTAESSQAPAGVLRVVTLSDMEDTSKLARTPYRRRGRKETRHE